MSQNSVAQFVQLLRHWLCDLRSGIVMGKNWVLSIDQCQLHRLHFSVHLVNLLSLLIRCNGFARIQKAVVDQTSSRPPNSDYDLFVWCKFGFGSILELFPGPTNELVIASCCIHFLLHVTNQSINFLLLLLRVREDDTSKQ